MGIILKRYRIILNMTRSELASKARISKTYIYKIEQNICFPSPPILRRISAVLNVCPYDLIDFCTSCPLKDCYKKSF